MKLKLFIPPLVIASLITGLLAGLFRIGWYEMEAVASVSGMHGALMVGSFLGTLITLERIIPLKNRLLYFIPIIGGSSVIFFILGWQQAAMAVLTAASVGMSAIMYYYWNKYKEIYQFIMFLGAICWMIGNALLLLRTGYFTVVPWWMAFLLLTIVGERLELTRFLPISSRIKYLLMAALALFVVGCALPFHLWGSTVLGLGLITSGAWLLKWDIARKAIKKEGIHRYSGSLLIAGYVWLLAAGAFIIFAPMQGFMYDAVLHCFFIGFTFSMIFAHAPIILPAVLGMGEKVYHNSLYVWAVLLHGSLIMRVAGDLAVIPQLRKWSGMVSGLVILFFLINMAVLAVRLHSHTATVRKSSQIKTASNKQLNFHSINNKYRDDSTRNVGRNQDRAAVQAPANI